MAIRTQPIDSLLPPPGVPIDEGTVRKIIQAEADKAGSFGLLAKQWGISPQMIHAACNGKKRVSQNILDKLELEEIEAPRRFRRKIGATNA